jgi:transmembrane sensor
MKHLQQTISADEQKELDAWLQKSPANRQLLLDVSNDAYLQKELSELTAFSEDAAWDRFQQRMHEKSPVVPIRRAQPGWWKIAAAVVGIVALGWLIKYSLDNTGSDNMQVASKQSDEIKPGRDKAYLQLADGTIISLDSAMDGTLANQGKTLVTKKDHVLAYSGDMTTNELVYNTISTPRGGEYQLQLADGTKIWLNAASSIRFPVAFSGNDRTIEITGEVYLEVQKDPVKPFRVNVPGKGTIEVLGTHFNVNAYSDELTMNTTLVEGSVRVQSTAGVTVELKPRQQAQTSATANNITDDIDTEEVTAWTTGWFNFNRAGIPEIMRQVSRWYNVDVVYEGKISSKSFSGIVSRSNNVSEVLKIMEKAGVHFRIEGRTITVLQ